MSPPRPAEAPGEPRVRGRIETSAGTLLGLTAAVLLVLLLRRAAVVLLVLFGGVLIGTALGRFSRYVEERSRLSRRVSLLLILIALLLLVFVTGWLLGPGLVEQVSQLAERVPTALREVQEELRESRWVPESMAAQLEEGGSQLELGGVLQNVASFFATALGVFGTTVFVLFIGLYIAYDPALYVRGLLHLVPRRRRERASGVLDALGLGLGWWFVGRLGSMTITGGLTTLGLLIVGMPLPLALGALTGALSFVPYLGPIAAAIPAVAIAWGEGGGMVAKLLGVLAVVQFIEGNLLTPFVLQRAVSLPPALLMGAQLVMGTLVGLVGVLFAAPLTVAVVILVQALYVEDVLDDEVRKLGDHG